MKKTFLLTVLFIVSAVFLYPGSISSVKVGFETRDEGPSPTSVVFRGDHIAIVWRTSGIQGNVRIELCRVNNFVAQVISPQYPHNDLPKVYRIPSGIIPGKYYVKISQGRTFGKSNIFTIKKERRIAWVNVFLEGRPTPPRGFTIGQTLAISWDTTHILGKVTVKLKMARAPFKEFVISTLRPYNDIPATYRLHNGLPAGYYHAIVMNLNKHWKSKRFKINRLLKKAPLKGLIKKK